MEAEDLRVREELVASRGSLARARLLSWRSSTFKKAARFSATDRTVSNGMVAWRGSCRQEWASALPWLAPGPGNGMNYRSGCYRKHPREKPPAIVLRIW